MPQSQSPGSTPAKSNPPKSNPIVIKKYANRRLYNTDTSSYVTLDDLCQMIKQGGEIIVYDAKNGDDITRSVLTQIIVEQESKDGQNLLPTSFLRQLISLYGNNMQGLVPKYLDHTMQSFTKNQHQFQEYFRNAFGGNAFGGMFPMAALEEMGKQNMAMFEQAMRLFAPFAQGAAAPAPAPQPKKAAENPAPAAATPAAPPAPAPEPAQEPDAGEDPAEDEGFDAPAGDDEGDSSIRDMQQRLNDLQKQIAGMQKND